MGVKDVDKMSQDEYRKAAVDAVRQLSVDVGIPQSLKDIVKPEDLDYLAECAIKDACAPGNPRDASKQDVLDLFKSLMK